MSLDGAPIDVAYAREREAAVHPRALWLARLSGEAASTAAPVAPKWKRNKAAAPDARGVLVYTEKLVPVAYGGEWPEQTPIDLARLELFVRPPDSPKYSPAEPDYALPPPLPPVDCATLAPECRLARMRTIYTSIKAKQPTRVPPEKLDVLFRVPNSPSRDQFFYWASQLEPSDDDDLVWQITRCLEILGKRAWDRPELLDAFKKVTISS
jgi:hypothetical protein